VVLLLDQQPVQHWLVPPWLALQLPTLLLLHLLLVLLKIQSRFPWAPHQVFSQQLLPQLLNTGNLQLTCSHWACF
jgi:hypothetical protein